MPKNVMKLLKPSPHRARNDFDLSHRHVFPINFGELLPSTCIETVPGDHIEMHISDLMRAIPMVTSPFLRAKQHTDVWFVPYNDLWHQFNNFITQKKEPVSSAQYAFNFLPRGSLKQLFQVVASGDTDVIGRDFAKGRNKLLNLLGYGTNQPWGAQSRDASVNLFRLAAYNFIWYNEYRQQYYDDGSYMVESSDSWLNGNPSALFNFDYLQCDDLGSCGAENSLIYAMTQMRYRCWKKDLFTGLLPSTQFGAVSTIDLGSEGGEVSFDVSVDVTGSASGTTGNDAGRWDNVSNANNLFLTYTDHQFRGNDIIEEETVTKNFTHDHLLNGVPVTGTGSGSGTAEITSIGGFDMLALRKSEAVQIWRENALRAGNHVKDNMMAHYGVETDFNDHRPRFLGSVSSPLSIGDVMTTANSSSGINDTVGDIAGKGISSLDEKVFKFDAKDFGVIMAITSILPEAEYNAEGVSRPNQLLDAEDFYVPEYENLGLEAVSADTFQFWHARPSNKVIGYAPRYWAYKTKLDKCYSSFMTNGIYAPWCSPKYDVSAALSQASPVMPLSCLYVNPKIFDVNFTVSVDNQDQFLCDMYFDVDAVRPMSVVGLPFS